MSQHDFDIANQTASNTRIDINNALKALGSLSSGATAPTTTYANMFFYNSGDNWLYMRNESDSAWLRFAYMDQTNGLHLVDDTEIVNLMGTKVGQLGDQATSTWQAGTGTTQSLVSPANVKSAVLALAPPDTSIGVGQTWVAVSRVSGTWYQNTTGRAIGVYAYGTIAAGPSWDIGSSTSNYVTISMSDGDSNDSADHGWVIVPVGHYYRNTGTWNNPRELR